MRLFLVYSPRGGGEPMFACKDWRNLRYSPRGGGEPDPDIRYQLDDVYSPRGGGEPMYSTIGTASGSVFPAWRG